MSTDRPIIRVTPGSQVVNVGNHITIPSGLLTAARSLWDSTTTLPLARRANPEYLRGQVETIMRASEWDASAVDSDEVKQHIALAIFRARP